MMKKQLLAKGAAALFTVFAVSATSYAQTNTVTQKFDGTSQPAKLQPKNEPTNHRINALPQVLNPDPNAPEATLWTEDFANGFANSTNGAWTVGGANSNLVEYDTDGPDNLSAANGWGPLPSPTAANGFAIMDWFGNLNDPGTVTTPAKGTLTSPVINLGTETDLEICFYSMLYDCCNFEFEATLDISTDGGLTFPNTIVVNDGWGRNEQHWNLGYGYKFRYKIRDYIMADPTNVVLRFNWRGDIPDANGQTSPAYFWMIDDIEIRHIPNLSLLFTDASGAPAHDAIFDNDGANSKHGVMALDQITDISFDSNILNWGLNPQTNVKLQVDIFDANTGTSVASRTAAANNVNLNESDTATFVTQFTTNWTPPGVGTYDVVFTATSDSTGVAGAEVASDTVTCYITDNTLHSLDWNVFSNNVGTDDLGDDGSAMLSRLYFPAYTAGSTSEVYIHSVDLRLSVQSDPGGDVVVELFAEDPNFDASTGFSIAPIATRTRTITTNDVGGTATILFQDSVYNSWLGEYQYFGTALPDTGDFNIMVSMFSNAGANAIQLANDQTITQPAGAALMFNSTQSQWFGGFANSDIFNAPWIRARMDTLPSPTIGTQEIETFKFDIFPNPTTNGKLNINISEGGEYEIGLMNTLGQFVYTEKVSVNGNEKTTIDVSEFAKGIYFLNLKSDKGVESKSLTIK